MSNYMPMNLLFTRDTVNEIFNNDKFQTLMWRLCQRWLDEKEYEDINYYAAPIEDLLCHECLCCDAAYGAVMMTKRPFGFRFVSNYCFASADGKTTIQKAEICFQFYSNGKCAWSASPID